MEHFKCNSGFFFSYYPAIGTAVMAVFPNVYVAMVMISTMGIISMSISYCPYALLGQYHEMKEVQTYHITSFHLFLLICNINLPRDYR